MKVGRGVNFDTPLRKSAHKHLTKGQRQHRGSDPRCPPFAAWGPGSEVNRYDVSGDLLFSLLSWILNVYCYCSLNQLQVLSTCCRKLPRF